LLLQRSEGTQLALLVDQPLDRGRAESTDQFVLQIGVAQVEAERFHPRSVEVVAEAGASQATPKVGLLGHVAQSAEPDVDARWAEHLQELAETLRPPDRHDAHTLAARSRPRRAASVCSAT